MAQKKPIPRRAEDVVAAAIPTLEEQIEAVEDEVESLAGHRTDDGEWTSADAMWAHRCLRAAAETLKAANKWYFTKRVGGKK